MVQDVTNLCGMTWQSSLGFPPSQDEGMEGDRWALIAAAAGCQAKVMLLLLPA